MHPNLVQELAALARLTVGQLRLKFADVFGEETRSGNKAWLVKRVAWRLQARAEGDLSERARQRAEELARDADLRLTPPRPAKDATPIAHARTPNLRLRRHAHSTARHRPDAFLQGRDPASPSPGARFRLRRAGLSDPVRRGQGRYRVALQRLPLLPPARQGGRLMNTASNGAASKTVRCAVYTRKSTEEGLNQEFNSLDAQREAAEAYIASQCHEGWLCLPQRYDDGGFTGANMDRPALKRLLDDIQAGKIDCVVVYKVDRLSRSLLDFAKMMETFDQQRVAFVSVTQQFNTATSMGRLVLNVLLSFAQFEREIISERTRDKIAATRRKGKWSGGVPLLGYDLDLRKTRLVVNSKEAVRVRAIFALYLELGGLLPVVRELQRRRWRTKRWRTRHGEVRGGRPFTKTNLHRLLTRVAYIGKVHHKNELYDGEQPAIVAADIWQQVQDLLKDKRRSGGGQARNKFGALLQGLLRCG